MRRPTGDAGNALVEFTYLAVLLMIPLVYVLLSAFQVQRAAFGVTEAARQAGRAYTTAIDPAAGRARTDEGATAPCPGPPGATAPVACRRCGSGESARVDRR